MKIGIVYAGKFPWNRGIGQLYESLEERGHKVYVICLEEESRYAGQTTRYNVIYLYNCKSLKEKLKTIPLPFNPYWKIFLNKTINQYKIDCLFVRETHILPQALVASNKVNIPCVVDMRENLPAFYRFRKNKKIRDFILYNSKIIEYFEKNALPKCEHIFTVTDELREWLSKNYKLPAENISVLGNYPGKDYLRKANNNLKKSNLNGEEFKMVFAGNITEMKGLQFIIQSMKKVNSKHNCSLTIIGSGNYVGVLKKIAKKHGVSNLIFFKGMLAPDVLINDLVNYDIGLCPYLLNEFTQLTMPGKLFEYMAAGLPVLSSNRRTVIRVIKETECGIVYKTNTSDDIAKTIVKMINSKEQCLEMGENGRQAVLNYYNWKTGQKIIGEVLSKIDPKAHNPI